MKKVIHIYDIDKTELFEQLDMIVQFRLRALFDSKINSKLSVKEVAKELGVSTLTVHNYIKRGVLKAFKLGNRVWIKREDLDAALEEKKSLKYKR